MTDSAQRESRWNRPAQQARSQATQDLLLDSAERLFGANGIDETSVQDVAAAAGRSIGSLYHHFDTKEVLVHAVMDRILSDVSDEMDLFFAPARWDRRNIERIVRGYLRGTLGLDRSRPGYKRIGREASISDPETRARYWANRERVNEGLRNLLTERIDEINHPTPALAIGLVIDQLTSMNAARVDRDYTPTELSDISDDDYVQLMLGGALQILGIEAS